MRTTRQPLTTCSALAGATLILAAAEAQAAFTVSKGVTKNVTCASGVCSATAKKAVLNASDLTGMLANGDVKLVSGSKAKDIKIAAPMSWANTSRLTLDAYQGTEVDQPVTVTGTGALTVATNDGGSGGTFLTGGKGSVTFWDTRSSVVINGNAYVLKATLGDLASAIAGNPTGSFALAASYDAKHDGTYSSAPLAYFGGRFEGFGNTIIHLKVKGADGANTGLFAGVDGSIENLGLPNAAVAGGKAAQTGALAGYVCCGGTASNVWSSGSVTIGDSTASGIAKAGGLLGGLDDGATLIGAHSSAKVVGGGSAWAGGLIGQVGSSSSPTTSVLNSYATGNVSAGDDILGQYQGPNVGGLAGNVSTASGENLIQGDYATGAVKAGSGDSYAGGLIGQTYGPVTVFLSHATGSVAIGTGSSGNGYAVAGGLVGQLYPSDTAGVTVDQSYATGNVAGTGDYLLMGGLFGYAYGSRLTDSYSTGGVSTDSGNPAQIGGFGGQLDPQANITTSYSIGIVQNTGTSVGGFLGILNSGTQTGDAWDTDTSGFTQGCGYPQNCSGVTGLTTAQLQSQLPDGFSKKIWKLDAKRNGGFPYLIANPPSK